jgi:3-oxoacyl-[acyl-carrier-protein] synthase-3
MCRIRYSFWLSGWIEGVLQANAFIKSGMAKRCLVVGPKHFQVVDAHDRDSMIYSMALVLPSSKLQRMKLECYPTKVQLTLSTKHTICFGKSYNSDLDPDTRYIKMYGRKYMSLPWAKFPQQWKVAWMPAELLTTWKNPDPPSKWKNGWGNHYTNYTTDQFLKTLPMSIHELGNSSVATVPTFWLIRGEIENQSIKREIFCSLLPLALEWTSTHSFTDK